jgi:hypothetical protein
VSFADVGPVKVTVHGGELAININFYTVLVVASGWFPWLPAPIRIQCKKTAFTDKQETEAIYGFLKLVSIFLYLYCD